MRHLIKTTEVYRIDTEPEVDEFIKQQKESSTYEVVKNSSAKKELKVKGEVIDTWYHVEITKSFVDEKDPDDINITVNYEVE